MSKERRYEIEHGWEDEWKDKYKFHLNPEEPSKKDQEEDKKKYDSWKRFNDFVKKWPKLEENAKVPKWYKFDPTAEDGEFYAADHNSLKKMDTTMFKFLKSKKWEVRDSEQTDDKKNKYVEKSEFVVDCDQLLGIGGEAVVIRKNVADKVRKEKDKKEPTDPEFEALKIIPMMKHNFESEQRLEDMKKRVDERHDKANIEIEVLKRQAMAHEQRIAQSRKG